MLETVFEVVAKIVQHHHMYLLNLNLESVLIRDLLAGGSCSSNSRLKFTLPLDGSSFLAEMKMKVAITKHPTIIPLIFLKVEKFIIQYIGFSFG